MGDTGKAEGRVTHPAPTATTATTQPADSNPGTGQHVEQIEVGFFRKALAGKVRPGVREPSVSHYMCDCCRWTA